MFFSDNLYCISSDSSDLPDMTVEYIDLSVLHTSCFGTEEATL